jgi:hypothetical protein
VVCSSSGDAAAADDDETKKDWKFGRNEGGMSWGWKLCCAILYMLPWVDVTEKTVYFIERFPAFHWTEYFTGGAGGAAGAVIRRCAEAGGWGRGPAARIWLFGLLAHGLCEPQGVVEAGDEAGEWPGGTCIQRCVGSAGHALQAAPIPVVLSTVAQAHAFMLFVKPS